MTQPIHRQRCALQRNALARVQGNGADKNAGSGA